MSFFSMYFQMYFSRGYMYSAPMIIACERSENACKRTQQAEARTAQNLADLIGAMPALSPYSLRMKARNSLYFLKLPARKRTLL